MVQQKPPPDTPPLAKPGMPQVIDVSNLLCGRDEVRLVHRGVEYRLRVTRQGKLLLTK